MTVLLVCNAGMSSGMIMSNIKDEIIKKNLDLNIYSTSFTKIDHKILIDDIKVILVGPQLSYMVEDLKEKYEPQIPVEAIDIVDYGLMDGAKILQTARKLMEDNENDG